MAKVQRQRQTYTFTRADLVKVFDLWQKDYVARELKRYPRYAKFVQESNYGEKVAGGFLEYLKEVQAS